MRETFDMMAFVDAVYLLAGVTTVAVIAWSWIGMRRAEGRRDKAREK